MTLHHRLIATACAVAAVATFASPTPAGADKTVAIIAKNFSFSPAVVRLNNGEPVTFYLRSVQGVHGMNVPEVGIYSVVLTGNEQIVHARPFKAGTFVMHCSIVCGAGHGRMAMTFIVQ